LVGVGLVAFIINLVTAMLVKRGSEHDLNLRSAFVHLMGDVLYQHQTTTQSKSGI